MHDCFQTQYHNYFVNYIFSLTLFKIIKQLATWLVETEVKNTYCTSICTHEVFGYSVYNILDVKSIQEEVAKEKRRVILTLTELLAQLNQSLK